MARILLSEVDPDGRWLLRLLLGRLGHEVVMPGEASLADVDLLVLEPVSGESVAHARAARAERPDLPILCVSILPDEVEDLGLGSVDTLAKPFTVEEFGSTVEGLLTTRVSDRLSA